MVRSIYHRQISDSSIQPNCRVLQTLTWILWNSNADLPRFPRVASWSWHPRYRSPPQGRQYLWDVDRYDRRQYQSENRCSFPTALPARKQRPAHKVRAGAILAGRYNILGSISRPWQNQGDGDQWAVPGRIMAMGINKPPLAESWRWGSISRPWQNHGDGDQWAVPGRIMAMGSLDRYSKAAR